MYIFDCLYGKIEFEDKVYQCMLTPEMQRLREVRLGNVNSIFLTGSANINRFEHSIGTAYLAQVNAQANLAACCKKEKDNFIRAALFHDLANGPFGHSYEYILEKQGFVPEKSIGSVIIGKMTGSHRKTASLEPIYFGQMNNIKNILNRVDIEMIDEIVGGKNEKFSKLISDRIDLDNIDNVFRMAYHMGINFDKQAPLQLAKGIICKNNKVYFKEAAVPYLYEWYSIRSDVYKLLLYNPQDFAAKCMLAEAIDLVLEEAPEKIKWNFTDSELIRAIKDVGEIWTDCDVKIKYIESADYPIEEVGEALLKPELVKKVLRECYNIPVPDNAVVECKFQGKCIEIKFYNTIYIFKKDCLYKHTRVCIKPAQIVTRLMCGDLYQCIAIYKTTNLECYDVFSELSKRQVLEYECSNYVEEQLKDKNYSVSFHAIVDKNKTNRQLDISLESGEEFYIGKSTSEVLIGVFLKSPFYGMAKRKAISKRKREELSNCICAFLEKYGISDIVECELYNEVDTIGKRN